MKTIGSDPKIRECRLKYNTRKKEEHAMYVKRQSAKNAERRKSRYETRKANGVCVSCGATPAVAGETLCLPCKERNKRNAMLNAARTKHELG